LADGFEDVEAVTPIDYLRRAGIEVTTVSISESLTVTSKWGGINISAAVTLTELAKQGLGGWDAVIIPGGMPGAAKVLSPLGILSGKKFTCYPGMEEKVQGGKWTDDRVAIDGNIITSRSAGTAGEFAVAIIGQILSEAEGDRIAQMVLL